MKNERLQPTADRAPRNSFHERHKQRLQREKEARDAQIRRVVAWGVGSLAAVVTFAFSGYAMYERQQQIDIDSKEVAALAKKQGFINAEAYKSSNGNTAYVTLWMRDCERLELSIRVDNVTMTVDQAPDGPKIATFSRRAGEEKVAGVWEPIVQSWQTPAEFCEQETGG